MSRFAKIAAISLMSLTTLASTSFAMEAAANISNELATMKAPRFTIETVASLDKNDPVHSQYDHVRVDAPQVHALQASIMSNKALSGELKARNVEINNIVGAQKAADGTVTFYIR